MALMACFPVLRSAATRNLPHDRQPRMCQSTFKGTHELGETPPPQIPQVESFIYPENCSVSNVVARHVEELVCSCRLTAKIVPI